jgi:hypothetical protein
MWDLKDLAGIAEIAARLGVTKPAVSNWKVRHADFPEPLITVSGAPIFSMRQVLAWYREWVQIPVRSGWVKGPVTPPS